MIKKPSAIMTIFLISQDQKLMWLRTLNAIESIWLRESNNIIVVWLRNCNIKMTYG